MNSTLFNLTDFLPAHLKSFDITAIPRFTMTKPVPYYHALKSLGNATADSINFTSGYRIPEGTNFIEVQSDYDSVNAVECFKLTSSSNFSFDSEYTAYNKALAEHQEKLKVYNTLLKEFKTIVGDVDEHMKKARVEENLRKDYNQYMFLKNMTPPRSYKQEQAFLTFQKKFETVTVTLDQKEQLIQSVRSKLTAEELSVVGL